MPSRPQGDRSEAAAGARVAAKAIATVTVIATDLVKVVATVAVTVIATALSGAVRAQQPSTAEPVSVVASFSILADLVRKVGGERVAVTSLVAAGADAHVFQPGPKEAKQLAGARVVVVNGLGFEGWLDRLIRSSGYGGALVTASNGIESITDPMRDDAHARHGAGLSRDRPEPARGTIHDRPVAGARVDPHAWQSVPNVRRYVANITEGLCSASPDDCASFEGNARRFGEQLAALDGEIRAALAPIAPDRRHVVTSHGAFGYYAREYGVTFLAPVGVSTGAEPSAGDVARLIRTIRAQGVQAYFVENITDPRLVERIAEETGGARPGRLYSDGLSPPDGPAADYVAMMRTNTQAIAASLAR